MSEHKDPLLVALKEGKSYTWTAPDGGDFASMRKAIKHGQTLTWLLLHQTVFASLLIVAICVLD